jgi:hypothetical protein
LGEGASSFLKTTILPFSFKGSMSETPALSLLFSLDLDRGSALRMLLSEAARDRGGLGGGVEPIVERILREFML